MGELFRLNNPIQNYAWGSHTVLAQMRGVPAPTDQPEAEVWVGAHPSAPSVAEYAGDSTALNVLVENNPDTFLGKNRSCDTFPYLFKILAIDAPLSIQVHPTDEQAQAGFADENARGIALDAPHRNYKDQFSKPETVIAVSDVKILTGVRDSAQLEELAVAFDAGWLKGLLPVKDAKALLTSILRLDQQAAQKAVNDLLRASVEITQVQDASELVRKAAELVQLVSLKHPGDQGLLVAFVMNFIELSPGDSAFTPDGQVHAYVEGTAIELMNPSDNVMRAGLTPKHIDTEELIKVLATDQDAPTIKRAQPLNESTGVYAMWDERLSVTRIRVENQPVDYTFEGTSTLLSVGGNVTVSTGDESFEVTGTESVMHIGEPVTTRISGCGELYIATHR